MKNGIIIFFSIFGFILSENTSGQDKISNREYFKAFFESGKKKKLLVIGENHSAGVSPLFYPHLVKYLNKKTGLNNLLIEFGPSEAFFYNKYLKTGNEKNLNYTLYAGAIKEWRAAWKMLYEYNKTLKEPIKIIGVDFDRTRTMAYALFSIFMQYKKKPHFVDSLMSEIRTDEFYNTYTIGYPTNRDIKWMQGVKDLLRKKKESLKVFLTEEDYGLIDLILANKAVSFNKEREKAVSQNIRRLICQSDDSNFFMLIGRNHAYYKPIYGNKKTVVNYLGADSAISILSGATLYENTEMVRKGKSPITLYEIEKKIPWKPYYPVINKKADKSLTIVPLTRALHPLAVYLDYILVARNKKGYELIN